MGNSDFTPTDGTWQIATSLTTASGMLFVTMGVSYVLSVLGAVVDKRSFASTVNNIDPDAGRANWISTDRESSTTAAAFKRCLLNGDLVM